MIFFRTRTQPTGGLSLQTGTARLPSSMAACMKLSIPEGNINSPSRLTRCIDTWLFLENSQFVPHRINAVFYVLVHGDGAAPFTRSLATDLGRCIETHL